MADKSISQLSPGVAVTDTDLLPNVQVVGVGPVKTTAVQIKTYVNTNPNVTGVIKAQLGSAAAPSYTFDGDLNTGWWSPAADTLAASTNGTEKIRITSAGNVGIGVTPVAPSNLILNLQVGSKFSLNFGGTTSAVSYNSYYDGNFKYITNDFAVDYRQNNNNGSHAWFIAPSGTAGNVISYTAAMTLNASGNLGIGTTSPATRTHIVGTDTELRVQSDTTANGFIRFINTSGSMSVGMSGGPTNTLLTYDRTNSQTAHEYLGGASGYHAWSTVGQERMRIDNIGNVGIGQVAVTPVFGRTISAFNASGATYRVAGSSVSAYLYVSQGLGTTGVSSETNHPLVFGTNSTERMRIDTSGNVGIGVTPSAWFTGYKALDIGTNAAVFAFSTNSGMAFNAVDDGAWKYKTTAFAGRTFFSTSNGSFAWLNAASGTAGNAITFTQAMTLTEQGSLLVGATATTGYKFIVYTADGTFPASGDTSASYALISGASRTGTSIVSSSYATTLVLQSNTDSNAAGTGASLGFQAKWDSGNYPSAAQFASIFGGKENSTLANLSGYLSFATRPNGGAPTERMRISSAGNVGIGTSTPAVRLDINGTTYARGNVETLSGNSFIVWNAANTATGQYGLSSDGSIYINTLNAAGAIWFGLNSTERMRIDNVGNVGIALAPSAWLSSYRALNVQTGTIASAASSSELYVSANSFLDTGPTWKYVANSHASQYRQAGSVHSWHIAASGTAGNAITFTQAMTLDASGNLSIGTTAALGRLAVLTTQGNNTVSNAMITYGFNSNWAAGFSNVYDANYTDQMMTLNARPTGGTRGAVTYSTGAIGGWSLYTNGQVDALQFISVPSGTGVSGTERMRIDGNGNVVINTAGIATNATNGFLYVPSCAGTPTGTPTAYAGRVPIVVDTTNNKLYFYSGSAWRDAGP